MFNSNILPISAPLQDTKLRNMSYLDLGLSRPLKVKYDGVIGLSIYGFLLIYISNRMSTSHRLAVIATQNCFLPVLHHFTVYKYVLFCGHSHDPVH